MNIDNKSGGGDWEERIYFMDNLRAVAMFLGVVLHAAILYCYFPLFARPEPTDCPRMIYIRFHGSRIDSLNSGKIDVAGKSSLPF